MPYGKPVGHNHKQGRSFEKLAAKMLTGAIDKNINNCKGYYDVLWKGYTIDVKSREFVKGKGWSFTKYKPRKDYPMPDYFLCYSLYKGKIVNIYFFPEKLFGKCLSVFQKDITNRQPSKYLLYKVEQDKNGKLDNSALEIINHTRKDPSIDNHYCSCCKQWKTKDNFYKGTGSLLRGKCKDCYKEQSRKLDALRSANGYYKKYKKKKIIVH